MGSVSTPVLNQRKWGIGGAIFLNSPTQRLPYFFKMLTDKKKEKNQIFIFENAQTKKIQIKTKSFNAELELMTTDTVMFNFGTL